MNSLRKLKAGGSDKNDGSYVLIGDFVSKRGYLNGKVDSVGDLKDPSVAGSYDFLQKTSGKATGSGAAGKSGFAKKPGEEGEEGEEEKFASLKKAGSKKDENPLLKYALLKNQQTAHEGGKKDDA